MSRAAPVPTPDQCNAFFREVYANHGGAGMDMPTVTHTEAGLARLHWPCGPAQMRPGGGGQDFISGPSQMHIADTAAYVAVFTHTGIEALAVTSSLSIEFLRAARGTALHATARTAKHGRALTVVNVEIRTEAAGEVVSQAVVVYSLGRVER